MLTHREKAEKFAALHRRRDAFVIPNPWDIGSARLLAALGFEALATTSAGCAWARGGQDGELGLEATLSHCRELVDATDLPVSADFENGFAEKPEGVAEHYVKLAETGVAGGSIEDFSGDPDHPIHDFNLALERVQAAVEAVHSREVPFTLTARAENLLHGVDDLDDTLRRLQAFAEAGADVLYAPGLKTLEQVRTLTTALDRPVNVLAPMVAGASVDALAAAGAKRLSIGGTLASVAYGAALNAASGLGEGTFERLAGGASRAELGRMLHAATPAK